LQPGELRPCHRRLEGSGVEVSGAVPGDGDDGPGEVAPSELALDLEPVSWPGPEDGRRPTAQAGDGAAAPCPRQAGAGDAISDGVSRVLVPTPPFRLAGSRRRPRLRASTFLPLSQRRCRELPALVLKYRHHSRERCPQRHPGNLPTLPKEFPPCASC